MLPEVDSSGPAENDYILNKPVRYLVHCLNITGMKK